MPQAQVEVLEDRLRSQQFDEGLDGDQHTGGIAVYPLPGVPTA
jgi:hypothetical protein